MFPCWRSEREGIARPPRSMDDPFFAEDDGEFDDFYGNKPTSQPPAQATIEPKRETSRPPAQSHVYAPASEPPTPSMAYPATPASSVGSFMSKSTDGGGLPTTSSRDKPRERRRKPRRKHSQELFQVEWEKDADVTACYVCSHDFSMLRRKHHCRRCGRVICSDCSSFWRFETTSKHRVCSYCNVELANSNNSAGASRHRTNSGAHTDDRRRVPEDSLFAAQRHDEVDADGATSGGEDQDDFAMPRPSDDVGHRRRSKTRSRDYGGTGSEDARRSSASASYVSATESLEGVVAVPTGQLGDRSTFYNDDADKLVVDDAPGYYEYMRRSHERPMPSSADYAMSSSMPRPPPVTPESDGSSGVLVEVPEHPSGSPPPVITDRRAQDTQAATPNKQKGKRGFAGAIKRFFGMSKHKQSESVEPEENSPTSSEPQRPVASTMQPVTVSSHEHNRRASDNERNVRLDMPRPTEIGSAALDHYDRLVASRDDSQQRQVEVDRRSTAIDRNPPSQASNDKIDSLRHTVSGYMQPPTGSADSLMRASVVGVTRTVEPGSPAPPPMKEKRRSSTRNRRDTFDGLFDSPTKSTTATNTAASRTNLPSRPWASGSEDMQPSAVGVERFDQPRREDEMEDDFTQGLGHPSQTTPAAPVALPSRAWTNGSNEIAVGVDRFDRLRRNSEDDDLARSLGLPSDGFNKKPAEVQSRSAWSNVTSYSSTASFTTTDPYTYTTEKANDQPIVVAAEGGNRHRDHERTLMDDLRGSNIHNDERTILQSKGSVDDYFADFEKPNEYVFDTVSGTYVPARSTQVSQQHHVMATHRSSNQVSRPEESLPTSSHQNPVGVTSVVEASQDQIDGIIVDKISSLEGELQALKELLRMRRVPPSPRISSSAQDKKVESQTVAYHRPSIFDSEESDQDGKDIRNKSLSTKKERRSSSHKSLSRTRAPGGTSRRKRKDSFADLFGDDDDDNDDDDGNDRRTGNRLGSRSYESLFQIGASTESGGDNDSDEGDDTKVPPKRRSSRRSQRRRSRGDNSSSDNDATRCGSDEEEAASRFRRKKPTTEQVEVGTIDTLAVQTQSVVTHFQARSTKKARDEIDALFESDEDDGMDSLYETTSAEKVSRSKGTQETPIDRIALDKYDGANVKDTGSSHAQSEVSSDEEFSSTLRTLRSRRSSVKQRATEDESLGVGPTTQVKTDSPSEQPSLQTTTLGNLGLLREADETESDEDDSNNSMPVIGTALQNEMENAVEASTPSKKRSSSKLSREKTVRFSIPSNDLEIDESIGIDDHDENLTKRVDEEEKMSAVTEDIAALSTGHFDPLTLLEDEEDDLPSLKKTPIKRDDRSEPADWQAAAGTFESRLKASPFRDSLLDDNDVLGNSTSLNLDELLGNTSVLDNVAEETTHGAYSSGDEEFSFEIKPKQKSVRKREGAIETPGATASMSVRDAEATVGTAVGFETENQFATEDTIGGSSGQLSSEHVDSQTLEPRGDASEATEPSDDFIAAVDTVIFQDDWQRMQEEEKERKRKLQLKQRQAQREKLKKQPSSNRALGKTSSTRNSSSVPSSPTPGTSKKKNSKSESGAVDTEGRKKKKKHKKREGGDGENVDEARHRRSKHHTNGTSGFEVDAALDAGHEATQPSTAITEL